MAGTPRGSQTQKHLPDSPSREGYLERRVDEFLQELPRQCSKYKVFQKENFKRHLPSRSLEVEHVSLYECSDLS